MSAKHKYIMMVLDYLPDGACRPDDNELLDKIHDIKNVLNQRKQNLSLDNQTKQN